MPDWQWAGRIPLIADGGIKRDGAIIEALLFGGDTVMLGNAFAGTTETPGETVHKSVVLPESQKVVRVPFKVFRGMASISAMVDRLDVEDADSVDVETLGAEGLEVSVPLRGSARPVIAGHAEASIVVDQLRRGGEPRGAEKDVLGAAGRLHHQIVRVGPPRVV